MLYHPFFYILIIWELSEVLQNKSLSILFEYRNLAAQQSAVIVLLLHDMSYIFSRRQIWTAGRQVKCTLCLRSHVVGGYAQ